MNLSLDSRGLTDEQLKAWPDLDKVVWLSIRWNNITNEGVRHLCQFPNLEYVNLFGNPCDDPTLGFGEEWTGMIHWDTYLPPFGQELEKEFGAIKWLRYGIEYPTPPIESIITPPQ